MGETFPSPSPSDLRVDMDLILRHLRSPSSYGTYGYSKPNREGQIILRLVVDEFARLIHHGNTPEEICDQAFAALTEVDTSSNLLRLRRDFLMRVTALASRRAQGEIETEENQVVRDARKAWWQRTSDLRARHYEMEISPGCRLRMDIATW
ncbi:hypothetical protein B0H67DRAFT_647807 [Lasiosphaeris hirsuta]|uniref:Uncharacterized protein n=1 Tax=Lasiosphaeris hirsuta TaxID=260670 RepID=A0AA40A1R9_9PEZI|nr:hypothetical protein B0H67DRAFT_647807 [Lasiosphaeris hirsuta]